MNRLASAGDDVVKQSANFAGCAKRLGVGEMGKHECWYILDAAPGSFVYLGLKEGVEASEFVEASGTGAVVDMLQHF